MQKIETRQWYHGRVGVEEQKLTSIEQINQEERVKGWDVLLVHKSTIPSCLVRIFPTADARPN